MAEDSELSVQNLSRELQSSQKNELHRIRSLLTRVKQQIEVLTQENNQKNIKIKQQQVNTKLIFFF